MKITIQKIKELCTPQSFSRGEEYYSEGLVHNLLKKGSTVTAIVRGTNNYKVEINIERNTIGASCSCPYDWGGYCKHIVATLLGLAEEISIDMGEVEAEQGTTQAKISDLSREELMEFITDELHRNPILEESLDIYLASKSAAPRDLRSLKAEIGRLYLSRADSYEFVKYGIHINFTPYYRLAEKLEKKGNFIEAAKIYLALSEVIAENMYNVDDSDGYYGDEFTSCIENLAENINCVELPFDEAKKYIKYFFEKYIENEPDFFQQHYRYALDVVCNSPDTLKYWKKLLKPHLPSDLPKYTLSNWSDYYSRKDLFGMQLSILDRLNDEAGFYKLIESLYRKDHRFCFVYIERLKKDGRMKDAIKAAEEGVEIFPEHLTIEIREFLNKHYKKHDVTKYKHNLQFLFKQRMEWRDYDKLKKACTEDEWVDVFSSLVDSIREAKGMRISVVDLYLKEGQHEEALEELLKKPNLYELKQYHNVLADKFPEEYFKAYAPLIVPFAERGTGRPHYKEIAKFLTAMKEIRGFEEEFNELVENLRVRYARRPAFLDEIKWL
jgi:uncharacterized Zn finger protein